MQRTRVKARAAARGLVAAMAMTGARRVTSNVGLLEQPPADAIAHQRFAVVRRLSPETRDVVVELAHWSYGAGAGAVFGLLPARVRRHVAAGPLYGLAIWLAFELGLAPLLGVQYAEERKVRGRVTLALDHVLYGVVVAGRLAPPEEAKPRAEARREPEQPPLVATVATTAD